MTSQELAAIIAETGLTRKEWYGKVYLRSEHWRILRGAKLRQAGHKCEICGDAGRLEVHHLNYRNIFDVKLPDLQVLCGLHHDEAHGRIRPDRIKKHKPEGVPVISGLEKKFRVLESRVKLANLRLSRTNLVNGKKTHKKRMALNQAQMRLAKFLRKHPEFRAMTDFRM